MRKALGGGSWCILPSARMAAGAGVSMQALRSLDAGDKERLRAGLRFFLNSGAAFPLHRDLDEPIVGLLMAAAPGPWPCSDCRFWRCLLQDYMEGNPSVLGTSYSGSVPLESTEIVQLELSRTKKKQLPLRGF